MEHETSLWQIILNVAIQLFNIALFFWVVIKFLAKPLSVEIEERVAKEKKLAAADETYQQMIKEAEQKANVILKEASEHKDNLIRQGELAGKQKSAEIVSEAERKAENIIGTANKQATLAYADLENHFVSAVQSTSREVIKKIFTDKQVEQAYMENLIKEFSQSASKK